MYEIVYAKIDTNFYMNRCECLESYSTQNVRNNFFKIRN